MPSEPTECVEHTQKGNKAGYGTGVYKGRYEGLHRISFRKRYGYFPKAVLHTCDNPRCINDDHLIAGDALSNQRDCLAKGRRAKAYPSVRTLTFEQAEEIRSRCVVGDRKGSCSMNALAKEYEAAYSTIRNIINRKAYNV